MDFWMYETTGSYRTGFQYEKELCVRKTPYQTIKVLETQDYGRVLIHDDVVMLTDFDESIYHEMMAFLPIMTHSLPQSVLIIGGGDGGVLREVLKIPSVERADLVEIDEEVIRVSKEFFPKISGSFDHPLAHVFIEDGYQYIQKVKDESYDVIIVDSTDPQGIAVPLFDDFFYQQIHRVLKEDGICVSQAESPFFYLNFQDKIFSFMKRIFLEFHVAMYHNISYPSSIWNIAFCSKKKHPIKDFQKKIYDSLDLDCFYYNENVHKASFSLPEYLDKRWKNL